MVDRKGTIVFEAALIFETDWAVVRGADCGSSIGGSWMIGWEKGFIESAK